MLSPESTGEKYTGPKQRSDRYLFMELIRIGSKACRNLWTDDHEAETVGIKTPKSEKITEAKNIRIYTLFLFPERDAGVAALAAVRLAGQKKRNVRARSTARIAPQREHSQTAGIMANGLADPAARRMVSSVVGRILKDAVLSTTKVVISSVAVPGTGFSRFSSSMARMPSGVAALPMPSRLALMLAEISRIPF